MCKILKISRGIIYYHQKIKKIDTEFENQVIKIFKASKNNYGTRKIKIELKKCNIIASRKRIKKSMKKYNLISNYTIKQYKPHKITCNEENKSNILNREFNGKKHLEVIVSDLTYVNVKGKWNYICLVIDLHNREIVGYSAGVNKTSDIVLKAFAKINYNLYDIQIFHTDRGNEFKNKAIDELLETFNIKRSLSKKGCPYDNAVAEATYKIIKTEFAFNKIFKSFQELEEELENYVYWFNNKRIHSSLNYLTPIEYKKMSL